MNHKKIDRKDVNIVFWVSAYTQYGQQFGCEIESDNYEEMITIFREENPDCEIAD